MHFLVNFTSTSLLQHNTHLKNWGEFATAGLHHFLGHDSADGSAHGVQVAGAHLGELAEVRLVVSSDLQEEKNLVGDLPQKSENVRELCF